MPCSQSDTDITSVMMPTTCPLAPLASFLLSELRGLSQAMMPWRPMSLVRCHSGNRFFAKSRRIRIGERFAFITLSSIYVRSSDSQQTIPPLRSETSDGGFALGKAACKPWRSVLAPIWVESSSATTSRGCHEQPHPLAGLADLCGG